MVKGVVQKINKNEQYGLTSFTLKGQDGWYSLGEDKPNFQEGDSVQFDVFTKGRYTYARSVVPWVDKGEVQKSPPTARGASFGRTKSTSKDDYWTQKELRDIEWQKHQKDVVQPKIEIQAARNAAIEAAKFLWEKGLVSIPKKQSEHYDAFFNLVNTIADDFVRNTSVRLGQENPSDAESEREDQPGASGDLEVLPDGVSGSESDGGNWD